MNHDRSGFTPSENMEIMGVERITMQCCSITGHVSMAKVFIAVGDVLVVPLVTVLEIHGDRVLLSVSNLNPEQRTILLDTLLKR